MKKLAITFIGLALALAVHAQSLSDNEYYNKSQELSQAAHKAFDAGEYDLALELAFESQDYARQSDEYVAMMLSIRAASNAIDSAQARYDWATSVRAEKRFAQEYAGATEELTAALSSFNEGMYEYALVHANAVEAYLSVVTGEEALPAYFVVRDLSEKHDCLWRIAGLPFVYNDPFQWPVLYKANKQSLPNPNNPDLILPGMTLTIPPLANELREGVWVDSNRYPPFNPPTK
ncbi:MAG: LysM peptidoglycan-binding domain-containing protein [Spirochaetia bacterium]|jgi:nucleoid-associated protein YgaU|nr:LysM peptidoglycan-binding domain-containing protein [Spirochaetia bacterium]